MKDDGDGDGLAYDSESSSVIKLNNGMVLYLREVNKYVSKPKPLLLSLISCCY